MLQHLLTVLLLDRPHNPSEYLIGELKKLQQHHAKASKVCAPTIEATLKLIIY